MISVSVIKKVRDALGAMLAAQESVKDPTKMLFTIECINDAISCCEDAHERLTGYKTEGEDRV